MKNSSNVISKLPPFQLKGSSFTLTVLHLNTHQNDEFASHLHEMVQQTPNFFKNVPVVIDLQALKDSPEPLDFLSLAQHMRQQGLIPVGIRHANKQQESAAITAGLGVLTTKKNETRTAATKNNAKNTRPKIITQPIRSGQQVYAQDSDLIILASVSAGAEVLADGHIHIYGALRGRALAGVTGDKSARIFCHQLDAQLVSIAGIYKLQDSLLPSTASIGTQIYLMDEQLQIATI
jgi:septum site-determining protein MinC